MEGKEKIILSDGTVFEIENGATINTVQIAIQSLGDFQDLFEKFSEKNLEKYQIQNAVGLTCANFENRYMVEAGVKQRENDILVSIHMADVDMLEKRVTAIETEQYDMKLGQEVQDGAIADIGEIIGEMLEGDESNG